MNKHRTKGFLVRMTEDELNYLDDVAARSSLNREEFCRRKLLGKEHIVLQDRELMVDLIREISRIGNNVNQLARQANITQAALPESIETMTAWLQEIRSRVMDMYKKGYTKL